MKLSPADITAGGDGDGEDGFEATKKILLVMIDNNSVISENFNVNRTATTTEKNSDN